MVEGIMATVDVRDMTCAQALAVVAKAWAQLTDGQALDVRYNAEDVKQDLLVWARELGHQVVAREERLDETWLWIQRKT